MRVDAYASEPHYARHIAPIWEALAHEERGTFYAGRAALPYITRHLVKGPVQVGPPADDGENVVLCAAFQDSRFVRTRDRYVVYIEHGAGQTYAGDLHGKNHPAYSGGREHEPGTLAILCPGPRSADNWRASYPHLPVHEVGPMYLDPWLAGEVATTRSTPLRVCVSFHANVRLCPETEWTFPYYQHAVLSLQAALDIQLIGHAHPRAWPGIGPWYEKNGILGFENFTEVLGLADIYVCDNSSTLYEFAATGRPVVALNGPNYRRQIHHGLRFWDLVPGLECDRPVDLPGVISRALEDPPEAVERREKAVAAVYHPLDGKAVSRAVEAVRHYAGSVGSAASA